MVLERRGDHHLDSGGERWAAGFTANLIGFGSRLIDRIGKDESGGRFERIYRASGLIVGGTFRQGRLSRWSAPD